MFFGDYERAASLSLQVGDDFGKALPAEHLGMMETCHRCLALYAMARRTKKRKYKNPANRLRKRIQSWTKQGNLNVKHYLCFLNALNPNLL